MDGTPPETLRKWEILSHWSDEELEKIVYVNIFRPYQARNAGHNLGALILTTDDEVFYVGPPHPLFDDEYTTLKTLFGDKSAAPKTKGDESTAPKTEIDQLSGKGIQKIEVCRQKPFCVALTKGHNLILWGNLMSKEIPESAYVCYELVPLNVKCPKCSRFGNYYPQQYEFAGFKFDNGCSRCFSSLGGPQVKLVNYKEAAVCCNKCHGLCVPHKIREHEVNYCPSCNYLPQYAEYHLTFDDESLEPKLMDLGESTEVVDVACGSGFFVALTKQNDIILYGFIDGVQCDGMIYNPDNVIVKAVFCGDHHIAAMTVKGDLYTCGLGSAGQLGYEWNPNMGRETLRKVPLGGKVVKVCCGASSTVCLMDDGSLMCFGSHMKILSPGVLELNHQQTDYISEPARVMQKGRFIDLINSTHGNVYVAKTETYMFEWGRTPLARQPVMVRGRRHLVDALADFPAKFNVKAPCMKHSTLSQHLDSELYGKKFLSDLTLKLSDGDFPAHRLILHANSTYFRDTFGESDSDSVLDMTSYNPEAYRCLIKYFYQVPPSDLKPTDLFDLYMLANSYKETDIAQEALAKLKANLNPETVLPLLRKAEAVNCSEFLEECNAFIQSPEFKHILAEKVSSDLAATMSVLEVFSKNK